MLASTVAALIVLLPFGVVVAQRAHGQVDPPSLTPANVAEELLRLPVGVLSPRLAVPVAMMAMALAFGGIVLGYRRTGPARRAAVLATVWLGLPVLALCGFQAVKWFAGSGHPLLALLPAGPCARCGPGDRSAGSAAPERRDRRHRADHRAARRPGTGGDPGRERPPRSAVAGPAAGSGPAGSDRRRRARRGVDLSRGAEQPPFDRVSDAPGHRPRTHRPGQPADRRDRLRCLPGDGPRPWRGRCAGRRAGWLQGDADDPVVQGVPRRTSRLRDAGGAVRLLR